MPAELVRPTRRRLCRTSLFRESSLTLRLWLMRATEEGAPPDRGDERPMTADEVVMSKADFVDRWRITWMEEWDQDYIDLVTAGHVTLGRDGTGEFQFGTVRGWVDYRVESRQGVEILEFSWEGENDNDPGCGRGWAVLNGNQLEGRLYIHMGDDSAFRARRWPKSGTGKEEMPKSATYRRRTRSRVERTGPRAVSPVKHRCLRPLAQPIPRLEPPPAPASPLACAPAAQPPPR